MLFVKSSTCVWNSFISVDRSTGGYIGISVTGLLLFDGDTDG